MIQRLALRGFNTTDVSTGGTVWFDDVWMWEATEAANASGQVTTASTDALAADGAPGGFAWWHLTAAGPACSPVWAAGAAYVGAEAMPSGARHLPGVGRRAKPPRGMV
ncbi:MAG TPA: hypothetical protein VLA19_10685 [Herpetosiphonaceae bacterium]|nr:hypothetical protein [Herpetosiphonaceae bacterium]